MVTKTSALEEFIICHYWYLKDKILNFSCFFVIDIMMYYWLWTVAIHDIDYCCIINRISKSEAINLLDNANKSKKSESSWIFFHFNIKNGQKFFYIQ